MTRQKLALIIVALAAALVGYLAFSNQWADRETLRTAAAVFLIASMLVVLIFSRRSQDSNEK